jgi:hypothetical protein
VLAWWAHHNEVAVNKHKKPIKPRPLALQKETIVQLTHDLLKDVAGGNNSTKPSQCPTLCFT